MIGYIIIVISLFMLFRNEYTSRRMREARELICEYAKKLDYQNYDYSKNYFHMKYEYNKYLLSLHLWGKYSAIKPEYKELLLGGNNS